MASAFFIAIGAVEVPDTLVIHQFHFLYFEWHTVAAYVTH